MRTLAARLPDAGEALPGRTDPVLVPGRHDVLGTPIAPPWPGGLREARFGLGCFWGAERLYWQLPGVYTTAVGYSGGVTRNPTYREVCTGLTGHAEVVRVVFDPQQVTLDGLLAVFWENHDPTQGMRQGNDLGTQYRSVIHAVGEADLAAARASRDRFAERLAAAGYAPITTGITSAPPFFYAEEYHQQYLAKNPDGYCGIRGTGVSCPVEVAV